MVKDLVIEKAKNGEYGFAIDRIMRDYRVKHAYKHNYLDCLRSAMIDYMIEQLKVAQYYNYNDEIREDTIQNLIRQVEAFRRFENDWDIACLIDRYELFRLGIYKEWEGEE